MITRRTTSHRLAELATVIVRLFKAQHGILDDQQSITNAFHGTNSKANRKTLPVRLSMVEIAYKQDTSWCVCVVVVVVVWCGVKRKNKA